MRLTLLNLAEHFATVSSLGYYSHAGQPGDQRPKAITHQRMIVGNQ
jgi:hypothetical protein